MNITEVDINSIFPYDKNPRKIPTKAIEMVKESLKNFGWQQPIVVDDKNVIIVGHTRYESAKSLGMQKVPVCVAKLTKEQADAYRIADNRVNEETGWNYNFLQDELNRLMEKQVDLNITGFTSDELDRMFTKQTDDLVEQSDAIFDDNENNILNDVRMIQLFFTPEKEQKFRQKIDLIKKQKNINNLSDAVYEEIIKE